MLHSLGIIKHFFDILLGIFFLAARLPIGKISYISFCLDSLPVSAALRELRQITPFLPQNATYDSPALLKKVYDCLKLKYTVTSVWGTQHFQNWWCCLVAPTHRACCLVVKLCLTLCDPMDQSTPGPPIFHCLPELGQIHVRCFDDTVQPSHPLLSPSPLSFTLSQHQRLFQGVLSSHEMANVSPYLPLLFARRW